MGAKQTQEFYKCPKESNPVSMSVVQVVGVVVTGSGSVR